MTMPGGSGGRDPRVVVQGASSFSYINSSSTDFLYIVYIVTAADGYNEALQVDLPRTVRHFLFRLH